MTHQGVSERGRNDYSDSAVPRRGTGAGGRATGLVVVKWLVAMTSIGVPATAPASVLVLAGYVVSCRLEQLQQLQDPTSFASSQNVV